MYMYMYKYVREDGWQFQEQCTYMYIQLMHYTLHVIVHVVFIVFVCLSVYFELMKVEASLYM